MLRQPVRKASLVRVSSWEIGGGKSRAEIPFLLTEGSLKAVPAAPIRATKAQAPSLRNESLLERNRNRQHLPYPSFKAIQSSRENMQTFLQK